MGARKYDPTAQAGVNAVEQTVLRDFRWIWREQHSADFGVDGHIEVVSDDGKPTGQLIAVQVKSGPSYFKGTGGTVPFYVGEAHLKYWDQHCLPMILALVNLGENQTILWQWANLKTARSTTNGWCIDIPKTKLFDATSRAELQDLTWPDDSFGLRRRFALDREWMKEFEERDAWATIDVWVNKTLMYREIEIRFDDPNKEPADYTMPIMATSNYTVSDIMRHFLPWLDHEYDEKPKNFSGEVEDHVLYVRLNRPAKAFLELEAFYENPSDPEPDESEDAPAQ
jgi:hypothetical protein